jgi:protein-L-isoaspartate(D-aspartate) O-methyltransferase
MGSLRKPVRARLSALSSAAIVRAEGGCLLRPTHHNAASDPMPMDYTRARSNMVQNQLRPNRVDDPNVLSAMAEVPRERFLPKMLRSVAYADEDLPLPDGSWLIEPRVLARLIQATDVRPSDVVLVIGCTTGYAGAVLSRLAGTVILVEPPSAAERVEALLDDLGVDNVVVVASDDPASGHPSQAPFDGILVVGSVPGVPPALFEQISEGGRIVAVIDGGRVGKATLFTKLHGVVGQRELFDAQTPPFPGLEPSPRFAF